MNNKKAKKIKAQVFKKYYDLDKKTGDRSGTTRKDIKKALSALTFKSMYRAAKKNSFRIAIALIILLFTLNIHAQTHLAINVGTNYSSYTSLHNDKWQFGPYGGLSSETKIGKKTDVVMGLKLTRKGSKASGRWVIPETNNLNTDYIQFSAGIQYRPFYHLSISLSPYYAYMLQANTAKWNYGNAWHWNINYMRRHNYGFETWGIYHFKDIDGKENIFSIQGGFSLGINKMAAPGFEMHPLRNKVASLGFALKLF